VHNQVGILCLAVLHLLILLSKITGRAEAGTETVLAAVSFELIFAAYMRALEDAHNPIETT
jgi:hypothetical protein